jgi:hypothetical protein
MTAEPTGPHRKYNPASDQPSTTTARSSATPRANSPEFVIKPGSKVKFVRMPLWVKDLPAESQRVFEFCLGRTYCVEGIDSRGLVVLDVSGDVDQRFDGKMNDIRIEAEFLEETQN